MTRLVWSGRAAGNCWGRLRTCKSRQGALRKGVGGDVLAAVDLQEQRQAAGSPCKGSGRRRANGSSSGAGPRTKVDGRSCLNTATSPQGNLQLTLLDRRALQRFIYTVTARYDTIDAIDNISRTSCVLK